jgi:hypothetical protein
VESCNQTCEIDDVTDRECCTRQKQNSEALVRHLQTSEHREHCSRGACTFTD